jgi:hypothetical protein
VFVIRVRRIRDEGTGIKAKGGRMKGGRGGRDRNKTVFVLVVPNKGYGSRVQRFNVSARTTGEKPNSGKLPRFGNSRNVEMMWR